MRKSYIMSAIAGALVLGLATAAVAATKGEFGNRCAMSLVNGKQTPTDCSINESYQGKTYCFGSQEARDVFMKSPDKNLAKAEEEWMKVHERANRSPHPW